MLQRRGYHGQIPRSLPHGRKLGDARVPYSGSRQVRDNNPLDSPSPAHYKRWILQTHAHRLHVDPAYHTRWTEAQTEQLKTRFTQNLARMTTLVGPKEQSKSLRRIAGAAVELMSHSWPSPGTYRLLPFEGSVNEYSEMREWEDGWWDDVEGREGGGGGGGVGVAWVDLVVVKAKTLTTREGGE
ncbi:hypothetical protein CAC42_7424 [Sphaceloma murrayae]|uniref:Uncharacterized protein n=1 Tax=Sphaceloma murrayae TaxID=2082308 RepID=A0A2K1QX83_9PEZI|nr:hypothetical protein CAC42_7424 [Sphaceloma murrayae]